MTSLMRRPHSQEDELKSRSQHRPTSNEKHAFNVQPQTGSTSFSYLTQDDLLSSPYTSFHFSSLRATSPLLTTRNPTELEESQLLSRTLSSDSNSSASSTGTPTFFPPSTRLHIQHHLSCLGEDTCAPRYDSNSFTFDSSDSEEEEELIGTPRDREVVVSDTKGIQGGFIGGIGSHRGTADTTELQEGRRSGAPMSRSGGMSKSPLGFVQSFGNDLSLVAEEVERKNVRDLKTEGEVGLGLGLEVETSRSNKSAHAASPEESWKNRSTQRASFAPLGLSPHSDEFVFHPSPSFGSYALEKPISPPSVQSHQSVHHRDYESVRQVYNTPPHSRNGSHTSSLGPDDTHTVPTTPPAGNCGRALLGQIFSLPATLPPPFVPSRPHSSPQSPSDKHMDPAYPLSLSDAQLVASLHNGRVPTMEQLAPADTVEPGLVVGMINGSMPIVNTGNQGPMIVQAGDWKCGVCAFVNWRRRRICMKCFPFANDVGNVITINSHRAATLAYPPSPELIRPPHQQGIPRARPTMNHYGPPSAAGTSSHYSFTSPSPTYITESPQGYTQHQVLANARYESYGSALVSPLQPSLPVHHLARARRIPIPLPHQLQHQFHQQQYQAPNLQREPSNLDPHKFYSPSLHSTSPNIGQNWNHPAQMQGMTNNMRDYWSSTTAGSRTGLYRYGANAKPAPSAPGYFAR